MWQVRGHDTVLWQFQRAISEGRLAHAYLLVGPPQVGKRALALNVAQAVNCLQSPGDPCGICQQCRRIALLQHADVLVIGLNDGRGDGPSRREVGIDEVREVQRQASLRPFEGAYRVFIFDGAEHLSEEASNALLKTLEEPPPQVLILLSTSTEEALLPTIRSRCRRVELRPLPISAVAEELIGSHSVDPETASQLARLSMGRLGWALTALSDPSMMERREAALDRAAELSRATITDRFEYAAQLATMIGREREEGIHVLHLLLSWWRDILVIRQGAEEFVYNGHRAQALRTEAAQLSDGQVMGFIRATMDALRALDSNANPRLTLEVLMLDLPTERVS